MIDEKVRKRAALSFAEVQVVEEVRGLNMLAGRRGIRMKSYESAFLIRIFKFSTQFSRKIFQVHWDGKAFFIASRLPLSFSERQGYTKFVKLPMGWRIKC